MSQVICYTEKDSISYRIMAGWDRPLRHYFLTVQEELSKREDEDDNAIFIMEEAYCIEDLLGMLPLEVPEKFWNYVARQEGNIMYVFEKDGTVKELM